MREKIFRESVNSLNLEDFAWIYTRELRRNKKSLMKISNRKGLTQEDNSQNLRKFLLRKIHPFKVTIKALEKSDNKNTRPIVLLSILLT